MEGEGGKVEGKVYGKGKGWDFESWLVITNKNKRIKA